MIALVLSLVLLSPKAADFVLQAGKPMAAPMPLPPTIKFQASPLPHVVVLGWTNNDPMTLGVNIYHATNNPPSNWAQIASVGLTNEAVVAVDSNDDFDFYYVTCTNFLGMESVPSGIAPALATRIQVTWATGQSVRYSTNNKTWTATNAVSPWTIPLGAGNFFVRGVGKTNALKCQTLP